MIKVQPSASRIVKAEAPDALTLTLPPKGFASFGGFMILLGLLWTAGAVGGILQAAKLEWGIAGAVATIPGFVLIVAGVADLRNTWTLKRTADEIVFSRGGLWGRRERKWPAQDVTSFWVEEIKVPREASRYVLRIGFRNGRSEDVLTSLVEEDVRWLSAMMKDPRGERRPAPSTARVAAEPVVRRVDPSVVPVSIVSRRLPSGGVELTFLPLIGFKRRWWKLLGGVVGGLVVILAVGSLIGPTPAVWISRLAVAVLLAATFVRFMTLSRSAVVLVDNGIATITQNQHLGNHQIPVPDIEFVQTFRNENAMELQFLIRGKPKVRLFYGRPADELEWAARFLRVALKHRPEEGEAPMKVDATAGECQVCSEKMERRVVFCAKCRTPHHEECWSYVGQCSTYGCREIRFERS